MPVYKLTYFPIKGVAEGNRLLLAYGGEDFEDCFVTKEEWPAHKHKTPFGQLPILEIDGKEYAQNLPIARYLGRKLGLSGKTLLEDLEIDQNIEFFYSDLRPKALMVHYEPDRALAEKRYAEFSKDVFPAMLQKLDEIITKNNGHLALGRLTWADFMFAAMVPCLKEMLRMPDMYEKYPSFKKVVDTVYALPKVKAYDQKSPKPATPFGQLPILEIDGKEYAQNLPIARYLGRKLGLSGKTLLEDLEIDQNIEFFYSDLRPKALMVHYEPDRALAEKRYAEFSKDVFPAMLQKLDEIITKNNGHLALGRLTWADFMFAAMVPCLKEMLRMPDMYEKYPSFKKVVDTVYALPKVKAYDQKSPKPAVFNLYYKYY